MTNRDKKGLEDISDSELATIYQQGWDESPQSDEEVNALVEEFNLQSQE